VKPPVDGVQLYSDLMAHVAKYVRLTPDEYVVMAAWILHCHTWKFATRTPYLNLTSATESCGKTLLLEVIEPLVPNPIFAMGVSAAVLPRAVHQERPVLLIDEVDQLQAGDKELWAAILQTVNSGYRKSGTRLVLERGEGGWVPKKLSTFCPKVLSGISGLPPATSSRCITITMMRMMPDDRVDEIDEYVTEPAATELFNRCVEWGKVHLNRLRDSRPSAPAELGHRQREVSRSLLAITEVLGEPWDSKLRTALVRLFAAKTAGPDDNVKIQLLHDLKDIFGEKERLASVDAVSALVEIADSGWASWGKQQKPINQSQLAGLLKDFKVFPRMQRNDDGTNRRGYDRTSFESLWKRYPKPALPDEADMRTTKPDTPTPSHDFSRNTATTPVNIGENEFSGCNKEPDVAPAKMPSDPHKQRVVATVAPEKGVRGKGEEIEGVL
jgi:hypothetical protein